MSEASSKDLSHETDSSLVSRSSRPCRNIALHGFCKYEGKGCKFNHEVPENPFSVSSSDTFSSRNYDKIDGSLGGGEPIESENLTQDFSHLQLMTTGHALNLPYELPRSKLPELQYHLYMMPPSYLKKETNERGIHDFFISESLREELLKKFQALIPHPNQEGRTAPWEVSVYHSIDSLEEINTSFEAKISSVYGAKTSMYKAINSEDGICYALRRIEQYRLHEEEALNAVESWQKLRHGNCVTLREAFTTKQFGDHSIMFVYDYFPCATTLYERHLKATQTKPVQERVLWGYICQLASAVATVHSLGLACRCIDATKVLITGKNRIRLNGLGVCDVLNHTSNLTMNVLHHQQEDLLSFGYLILSLAVGHSVSATSSTSDSISEPLEFVSRHCSLEFKNTLLYLLSKPSPMKHVHNVITMSANALSRELNSSFLLIDSLEGELMKELENGRLVRLLCQLGFVNERPEFDMDSQWSETGDRYLLKLFRDYVFHQVDPQGAPVIDMAFVLQCLNKLDAGYAEKIVLTTRDELSCLIVSYAELKQCLLHAINDLLRIK